LAKTAIYAAEAERLYVNEGMSIDTVLGILEGKVSRKTLYNWYNEGDWDGKRKKKQAFQVDIQEGLRSVTKKALQEAMTNPSNTSLRALKTAMSLIKMTDKPLIDFVRDSATEQTEDEKSEQKLQFKLLIKEMFGVDVQL